MMKMDKERMRRFMAMNPDAKPEMEDEMMLDEDMPASDSEDEMMKEEDAAEDDELMAVPPEAMAALRKKKRAMAEA